MPISHARRADPAPALRRPLDPGRTRYRGSAAVVATRARAPGARARAAPAAARSTVPRARRGEPGPDPGLTIPRPAHGPGHNSSWSHPRDRKCARTTLAPHVTRACAPRDPRSRDRIGVYLMDNTHHARHATPPYPSHIAERTPRAIGSATAPRPSRPKPSSQQRKSATLGHGDRSR
jgi:hypothetical protein